MEINPEVLSEIETLKEDVLTLQRNAIVTTSTPEVQFRSYGEYIKAYAHGDENAVNMFRVYTGGTSADSVFSDGWVGDKTKIIDKPRKVLNVFGRAPLPAEGMNVEYAKLNSNTTAVSAQDVEGDVLDFGLISVTTATAAVKTYGGYTQMTRQEIERANVNIVDKAFSAMAAKYAVTTNAAVRAAMVGSGVATTDLTTKLSEMNASTWLGLIVDSAAALDVHDYTVDAIIVAGDVFKSVATLVDGGGRPLLWTPNPSNNIGSVAGLSATIAGVPVVVDPVLPVGSCYLVSKEAITTYESAGAPFRLNDGDITNLSNSYSVYGYMATALHDANGIVDVVFAAEV